jgi:hypothetical protein
MGLHLRTGAGLVPSAVWWRGGPLPTQAPILAAVRGAGAGLAATLLLSLLARVMPGMRNTPGGEQRHGSQPPPPPDPFDPGQVQAWQTRSQSPAAFQPPAGTPGEDAGRTPSMTPAGALAEPQAPGPEGLAEQFAFKLAAGLFDRDIAGATRPAGLAVHLAYGTTWGILYGLLRASSRWSPALAGVLYGLVVWLVGPALLVPAMKLMRPLPAEPPLRTAMMITGHVAYGAALAATFEALAQEEV